MADDRTDVEQEAEPADWGLVERAPAWKLWDQDRPNRIDRMAWWFLGKRKEPRVDAAGVLEDPPDGERLGVCCSGGGIRSASFNLGALQTIQKAGRLQDIKYLSAVSGGSYIAAAFAMVAKTWDPGPPDPPGDDSHPRLVTREQPPFYERSPEEQYLRNRVSYMAPRGGGRLLLVWRIALGLLVNLLLIGATVVLLAAVLTAYYEWRHGGLDATSASAQRAVVLAGAITAGAGLALGVVLVLLKQASDGLRRALEVWSLRLFGLGLLIVGIELVLPLLIVELRTGDRPGAVQVGGGFSATIAGILAAVLAHVRARFADPMQAIKDAQQGASRFSAVPARLRAVLIYAAATILGPLLVFSALVGATVLLLSVDGWTGRVGVVGGALILFVWLMKFGDLTSWSLHPFYRRRLCTAFALRRVPADDADDVGHAEERRQGNLVPLSQTGVIPRHPWWESKKWPTLIICAAANVSDPGATPPGREVTTFTFSPHAMGGPLVGGIATSEFEQALHPKRQRDFTLPAAVAMSGAALSPSMGKTTRPSLRFLLALANVRLGVWVPNPRQMERFVDFRGELREECDRHDKPTHRTATKMVAQLTEEQRRAALDRAVQRAIKDDDYKLPRPSPRYLLKELLGQNSINDPFLYVSDGGHYENTGLVELLRRGCTHVYCFDASGGEPLSALGDAVALARSELGVEIEFPAGELDRVVENAKNGGVAEARCALGTITYPGRLEKGRLVYAPTVVTARLPVDVQAFKQKDPAFPHHSTLDQLFTDQKFEAYRVLGCYAATSAMQAMDAAAIAAQVAPGGDGAPAPAVA